MTQNLKAIKRALCRIEGAYAPNTLRAYYADANAFVHWCAKQNLEPFPVSSHSLHDYIEFMKADLRYSTIRRRISSLRRVNRILGHEDQTQTEEIYLAIRRLKRTKICAQRQAAGINHDLLLKMIQAQPDSITGVRNRALLSLGYDFLARRSELIALRASDLTFNPDGSLCGIIRRSKTDQYGDGRLVFGSLRSAKLVRKWLNKKPQSIEPLFCAINHKKCLNRTICDRSVNEIIKKGLIRVKKTTKPSDVDVSGHSLRVGAAQDLLIKGFDMAAIMRAGGWSSTQTVSKYLKFSQHNIWM